MLKGETGANFSPNAGFDWEDLPEEEKKRLLAEIKGEMPIEVLTEKVVREEVEAIFESGDPMEYLSEEQIEIIASDIPQST